MGIVGIGLASTITNLTMLILMVALTYRETSISEAVFWPNKSTFKGLSIQMSIALPILIMNAFDWWVYDLMIFMAGMYGVNQQAAQIALMNLMSIIYQFSLGFGLASTSIVGGIIGQGDVVKAKETYRIVQSNAILVILVFTLVVHMRKEDLLGLLTNIPEVHQAAGTVMFMLSINTFPEHLKGFQKGVIKALSLQHKSVIAHLIGNFGINLTLAYYFTMECDTGVVGIWYAKVIMEVFLVLAQTYIIETADWQKIIDQSQELEQSLMNQVDGRKVLFDGDSRIELHEINSEDLNTSGIYPEDGEKIKVKWMEFNL